MVTELINAIAWNAVSKVVKKEFQINYDVLSIWSSLPNVKWHSGLSGRHEAKMEVTAVVKKRGREKKSQEEKVHAGGFRVQTREVLAVR
jgi:hypothetical protein